MIVITINKNMNTIFLNLHFLNNYNLFNNTLSVQWPKTPREAGCGTLFWYISSENTNE